MIHNYYFLLACHVQQNSPGTAAYTVLQIPALRFFSKHTAGLFCRPRRRARFMRRHKRVVGGCVDGAGWDTDRARRPEPDKRNDMQIQKSNV